MATQLRIRLITCRRILDAASTPNPYDNLPQNPIPQPQQTTYMLSRTAQPRYESREPYRGVPQVDSAI